jgi:acetyltransferase
MADLEVFFSPRSITVIGASRAPRKIGYILVDNLQRGRYRGNVYPVNPHAERILGLSCSPSVSLLQETPDLALITVPRAAVADVLEECGVKGIRAAVVISAGFRETGSEGARIEQELLAIARRHGIRLVGPNSVGIINTSIGMNATFAETAPVQYEVGMLSQSGAVATAILDWAKSIGLGFSKFVSLGNMVDLADVDFLEFLGQDSETRIIVGYLEGIADGRRMMNIAKRITPVKPVVLVKVGVTEAGARAAVSHTGSLATRDVVVDAAFRQAGIIRATTMAELFDYTLCLAYAPLPRGPGVAVVTNAGGPAVMAADAIERMGLLLASISPDTASAVADRLPQAAATGNPIDLLGDAGADRYQAVLELVLEDPAVDALAVMLTPQRLTEPERTARVISYLAREHDKPILAVFMGGDAVARSRMMLDEARVPVYAYPERAIRALSALTRYAMYRMDGNRPGAAS